MRVLCINENWIDNRTSSPEDPVFNQECEVTSCEYLDEENVFEGGAWYIEPAGIWYRLRGYQCQYHASAFAILPEQSADEMSEESKEAIINIEHKPV